MQKASDQLKITPELLNLSDIEITNVELTGQGEFHIHVKSTKKEVPCHQCKQPTAPNGSSYEMKLQHLPILNHKVYIFITPPRGICKSCSDQNQKDTTTTQTLAWFKRNGRYTLPYEKHVLLMVINSTITDVSIKEGLGEGSIQGIIDRHIESKIDWKKVKKIGLLGIDEISIKKGHQDYVTIISSWNKGVKQILGVIKGKEKAAVKGFLEGIPHNKRKTITAVCTDLCDNYINSAKEVFGEAIPLVADRFHVAKLYRKEITKLRSNELKRLKRVLSDEEYKALAPAIKLLRSKNECYTNADKKILAPLFELSPAIKAAYRMARKLTAIFNQPHKRSTADKKLTQWLEAVLASKVKCLSKFTKTMEKYRPYILNYFNGRYTSGFVEGLNNKIKVIKRRCYGITNLKHFFQRIFLDLEGYNMLLNKQEVIV